MAEYKGCTGSSGEPRKLIGEILLQKGRIDEEQLNRAISAQKQTPGMLIGQLMVYLGYAQVRDVLEAHAEQLGIPIVDLDKEEIEEGLEKTIPRSASLRYQAIAIRRQGNRLTVAMADPSNIFAFDDIRLITGCEIDPVLADPKQIADKLASSEGRRGEDELDQALRALDGSPSDPPEVGYLQKVPSGEEPRRERAPTAMKPDEGPIIRVVNVIIEQAIKDRATNIAVEPDSRGVRVRYRIDGVLYEVMHVPKYVHAPLVSRLKIMADCNIAERKLLQQGTIGGIKFEGRDYVLKANFSPSIWGEVARLAVRPSGEAIATFESIGMLAQVVENLQRPLASEGLVICFSNNLLTAKQLLYAATASTVNVQTSVMTIEDELDAKMAGAEQVRVNPKAGMTITSLLRHAQSIDVDVVMVSNIPDGDSARQLVQFPNRRIFAGMAARTSDEVLFTLIRGYEVEPLLLFARLSALVGCKQVRRLCSKCTVEQSVSASQLKEIGLPVSGREELRVKFPGERCDQCRSTGYFGQIGIFEFVLNDPELADRLVNFLDLGPEKRREAISEATVCSFAEDALDKLLSGQTSLEEVIPLLR